jgi:hypothetical protein
MRKNAPDTLLAQLYTMADILSYCEGMKREDVYYLEERGYLHPLKQRHGRLERNLYTKEQVELLLTVWKYRRQGLSPRRAYEKALQENRRGQLALWENGES